MLEARAHLGQGGRVVIPAAMRAAVGLHLGDEVVLLCDQEQGTVRIVSAAQAVRRAQGLVQPYLGKGRSLADELIEERRREAATE